MALASSGCGGGGYNSPTTPTPTPSGDRASVTVSIVTTGGANSFTPNPASQMQGGSIAWHNGDGVTHRIVANDGSFDTGNIAAGATSQPVTPAAAGANYHCSIHPSMVGSIGSQQGDVPPPCTGQYCG
jgi:plastocyanin